MGFKVADYQNAIDDLVELMHDGELSEWEEQFVYSISQKYDDENLSHAQIDKIDQLWEKHCS